MRKSRVPCALLLLALLLCAVLPSTRAAAADPRQLTLALDEATMSEAGAVGIVVVDLETGYTYQHGQGTRFEAASLFKVFVMAAVHERARHEPGFMQISIPVARPNDVYGTMVLNLTFEPVAQAVAEMIEWSDNGATIALVDVLGVDAINNTLSAIGLRDSVVTSGEPIGNTTSARDLACFFTLLARRELVSPDASDAMTWTLMHQDINDRLPKGMPKGTLIAHKTGNSAGTSHDAGIVWTPWGERIVVVLTDRLGGEDARSFMESIGYIVYSLPAPEVPDSR